MSGTTTLNPASTRRGATACQVDPVRGCPWISSTAGPSPPERTRSVTSPRSTCSSRKPSNTSATLRRGERSGDRPGGHSGSRSVGVGDEHGPDAVVATLGLLGHEDQALDLDPGAGDGDLAQVLGHQAADGVDLVVVDLDAGDLVEVVDREAGGHALGSIVEGLDLH